MGHETSKGDFSRDASEFSTEKLLRPHASHGVNTFDDSAKFTVN